jgi:hypothetical protein
MERIGSRTAKGVYSVPYARKEENIGFARFRAASCTTKDEGRLRRALRRKMQPTA